MKIISYDPTEINDCPAFLNKYLDEFQNEDYLMFIFNDLLEEISDKDEFNKRYGLLMKILDLPFAFYPYYIHFNKILPESISKPNPRAHIHSKFGDFDIVSSPAYGMLIVDVQKLKSINFKFNSDYKLSFYIQDLVHKCYENKLWISETCFIDVFNSFTMLKSNIKNGFTIDPKKFNDEKEKFLKENNIVSEQINDFIVNLKKKYGTENIENAGTENAQ